MTEHDRRLIEDYLPVDWLSVEASSEPRTKGHISTLHLWRARRPLVACRAAVYAALVDAPSDGEERDKQSAFIKALCRWGAPKDQIEEARERILAANDNRRPRVLDFFAGGGSIPLEAARLGCDTVALDLNPVAYLILKATCEYPQRFGASLAKDVRKWADIVANRVQKRVEDLYPRIPMPRSLYQQATEQAQIAEMEEVQRDLTPFVFLWARTVECPNQQCRAVVPLHRQTWLRKKSSGYVALRPIPKPARGRVDFEVVEADTEGGLGFDPSLGLRGTATTCLCCRSAVPAKYVRAFGDDPGYGQQLLCVICVNPFGTGKLYLIDESWVDDEAERARIAEERAIELERDLQVMTLDAVIPPTGNAGLATGISYLYGIERFREAYTPRQRYVLLEFVHELRAVHDEILRSGVPADRAEAIAVYLGLWLSRLTDKFNALSRWNSIGEKIEAISSMKRFAMTWDYPEVSIFGGGSGDWHTAIELITAAIEREAGSGPPVVVTRGSAAQLSGDCFAPSSFDAVITDPPYYDNESYSELSDAFYVWLQPAVGHLFPEHFAGQLTPKRQECVAAAYRQGGTKEAANTFFETCLAQALVEARRVLTPTGILVLVYAHKTTAGWATLVNALREARFQVSEAWPIETEKKGRAAHQDDAALASSIFLVGRPRIESRTGLFEEHVRPALDEIAASRVRELWDKGKGLGGADLLMAAVGAGLQPYTRFPRVEYANGEVVPPEVFLREAEGAVLDCMLREIFGLSSSGVSSVDATTRFYILWRFTYGAASIDAGEAIVFCYPQGIEIDSPSGLSGPPPALMQKSATEVRLRTFTERGNDETLGSPSTVQPPIIDTLHRILWLMENRPGELGGFLKKSPTSHEQLRLVVQALSGPVLSARKSSENGLGAELSALSKLAANWRIVMSGDASLRDTERRTGQVTLPFETEGDS